MSNDIPCEGIETARRVSLWAQRPMRIGALQCNFEGGERRTLAVPEKWASMGMNVEQVFHPCADSYSALFDEARHGTLLRRYLTRLRKKGVRPILYLNVHILGPSLARHYRQWAQRRADGTFPKLYGTYYATCYNSPWRERFLKALEQVARYDIDGVFLDGPIILKDACHCPACRARHQEWFGKPLVDKGAIPFEFGQRIREEFLAESYRRFKEQKPEGVFYINLPLGHEHASYVDLRKELPFNDLVGTEGGFMFYESPKSARLWKTGLAARHLEAVAPDKPRVIFMAGDQKPWSWYMHQPGETVFCIASGAANGASLWYGLHGATAMLKAAGGRAASRMFRWMKQHEKVYFQTRSVAKAAILYSYETDAAWSLAAGASDLYGSGRNNDQQLGNHKTALYGFTDILTQCHVPHDLVTDLDLKPGDLAAYECVVLPGVSCMSDKTADVIRDYVRRGGRVVADFNTSLFDERGKQRSQMALADVMGVRALDHITVYGLTGYARKTGKHPFLQDIDQVLWPAQSEALDVRPAPGCRVLSRFLKPMAGRYVPLTGIGLPAVTLHRFGKGECLYLAGACGEWHSDWNTPEYLHLVGRALQAWVRSPVVLHLPACPVEVVARRQGERLIVHLVNACAFGSRPIERIQPHRNLELTLRASQAISVRALVANRKLATKQTPEGIRICLPELNEYEVLVVDGAY